MWEGTMCVMQHGDSAGKDHRASGILSGCENVFGMGHRMTTSALLQSLIVGYYLMG